MIHALNTMDMQVRKELRQRFTPSVLDYINVICENFIELHGDRHSSDDRGIVGGYGKVSGQPVVLVAHDPNRTEDGFNTEGSAGLSVNGYRKAFRLMRLAEKFNHPLLIFAVAPLSLSVIGTKKPLEALALAKHVHAMWQLQVPTVLIVLGHRGYGDIFGMWLADRILTSERGSFAMPLLDQQLHRRRVYVKAKTLESYKIIDTVVPEPFKGADEIPMAMAEGLRKNIGRTLSEVLSLPHDQLLRERAARAERVLAQELYNP